jgi:hypothetical protein
MAYTNLPPNLQDMFYGITDRVAKLETGPSSAQASADSAQTVSAQALTAANLANTQATTAIALAGTKNTVFYSGTAPTANAVNDQWINTADGNKLYIWNGTAWISVQDTAIAAAQSASVAAQSTANGKNAIYRQGTTPTTPYVGTTFIVGDIWFNTALDNAVSYWTGAAWSATSLGNNALSSISASKITAGTIDASIITVSNINAGNISTGTLAAARIATGSLNASVITSGTITASQIATGTITATQIATGTITATQISSSYIYAGTINATQITANSGTFTGGISAASGNIAGWTISSTQLSSGGGASYLDSAGNILLSGTFSAVGSVTAGSLTSNNQLVVTGTSTLSGTTNATGNRTGTSSTANGYFNSTSGYFTYSTASSERYKNSIVDLQTVADFAPSKILELRPRAFKYNNDYLQENDQRYGKMLPGFISEEIAEILPIAVDIQDGKIETWNERMLIPGIVALLQEQESRLNKLEGK